MIGRIRQFLPRLMGAILLLAGGAPAWGLEADQLLLITNSNLPEGRELAELYARERGVPDGRILEVPLATGEAMSAAQYQQRLVPAIRKYLDEQGLTEQVTCLVTFYGVPLRVGAQRLAEDDQAELEALRAQQKELLAQARQAISDLEQQATQLDPSFKPPAGLTDEVTILAARADQAMRRIESALGNQPPTTQQQALQQVMRAVEILSGPAGIAPRIRINPDADPESPAAQRLAAMKQAVEAARQRIEQLQPQQDDPAARAEMRELLAQHFGVISTAQVVAAHIARYDIEQASASVDSELALLWWEDYRRSGWLPNRMYHQMPGPQPAGTPRMLMVARIDAPTPEIARRIIADSVHAEKHGLTGNVAIDIGGSLTLGLKGKGRDEYAVWDHHLRALAGLVEQRTDFKLIMDQAAGVFTPGTVPDCALYCGWYSLRNYVPAFTFVRGAVAYHIASFELRAMRDPEEKGWVANLLREGVAATIGAVEEPYLQSFPQPDAFFGLLMTGRLTLAEVYWATTPMVSWKQVLIGDPLYRPFATNPALPVEALPGSLQRVIQAADSPEDPG